MEENAGSLLPDEEIALYTRPHWMSLLPTLAATMFLMAAVLIYLLAGRPGPNMALILKVFMVAMLGMSLYSYWVFQNTAILVTNRRVTLQRNMLVETASSEFLLAKAQTIAVRQSILGAMLGYGTVTLSGTGGATEVFPYVLNPMAMRAALQQQIEAATAPAAPAPTAEPDRRLGPVSGV